LLLTCTSRAAHWISRFHPVCSLTRFSVLFFCTPRNVLFYKGEVNKLNIATLRAACNHRTGARTALPQGPALLVIVNVSIPTQNSFFHNRTDTERL
jgi:hypothetical protein